MKTNSTLVIRMTRDSVCMGDDVMSPNEMVVAVDQDETLQSFLGGPVVRDYLPKIMGGKATWTALSGKTVLGVLAQEWPNPVLLVRQTSVPKDLFFRYHAQVDPHETLERVRAGNHAARPFP